LTSLDPNITPKATYLGYSETETETETDIETEKKIGIDELLSQVNIL
jgi:hypothetical protein